MSVGEKIEGRVRQLTGGAGETLGLLSQKEATKSHKMMSGKSRKITAGSGFNGAQRVGARG